MSHSYDAANRQININLPARGVTRSHWGQVERALNAMSGVTAEVNYGDGMVGIKVDTGKMIGDKADKLFASIDEKCLKTVDHRAAEIAKKRTKAKAGVSS